MRPYDQRIVNRPPHPNIGSIFQQFRVLDNQNRQLLHLAETVQRSSFMHPGPHPQMIYRLEQQLRKNLSLVIESIRDVFKDMDYRLRALGQALEQQSVNPNQNNNFRPGTMPHQIPIEIQHRQRQNTMTRPYRVESDPLQSLVDRISSLETNLKNTQQNQARLISIIQKIQRRNQEQPSLFKQVNSRVQVTTQQNLVRNNSKSHLSNNDKNNTHQTSFRLFTLQNNKSSVSDNERPDRFSNRFPVLCNPRNQSLSLQPSRMIDSSISPVNFQRNYAPNQQHRLSFMMKTLKS